MNCLTLLPAFSLALIVLAARAEAAVSPREEARSHFEKGVALADAGRFEEAVFEFERAYSLSPQPAVLFNVAVAYAGARRPTLAIAALRKYLAAASPGADQRRIRDARARLTKLEALVGHIDVITDPTGARLFLDGRPENTPLVVDPGEHVLTALVAGHEPATRTLRVAVGERRTEHIQLVPNEATPEPAPVGLLMVDCKVPDVHVSVDGAPITTAPGQPIPVKAGSRRVRFERVGYRIHSVTVEASPTMISSLSCNLQPERQWRAASSSLLRVRAVPADAEVLLDGEPFHGWQRVPIGRHALKVKRNGYEDWSSPLHLEPGRSLEVSAMLIPNQTTKEMAAREKTRRTWMLATAGAGLALAGVTTWLVLDNRSRYTDWQEQQRALDEQWRNATLETMPTTKQRANDERAERIKLQDEIAVGTGVASGALLLAAGVLFVVGQGKVPVATAISGRRSYAYLNLAW